MPFWLQRRWRWQKLNWPHATAWLCRRLPAFRIGFGIEAGEATDEDIAEQASLLATLKAWKVYKFALGKVTVQPTWYQAPVWPAEPPVPDIVAAPMLSAAETK